MIYIWEENEEFYSALPNKSEFINKMLALAKNEKDKPVESNSFQGQGINHPDPRIREIHRQVNKMNERDKQARG